MPFESSYIYRKEYEAAFVTNAEKESRAYLAEHESKLQDMGLKVSFAVMKGKPDHAILQYAEDHSVSVIALTTHGLSGIAKWAYGSVAARIIEGSTKPILLIRPSLPESAIVTEE
jgi:nucleotide-binding universal stress UspA family protein